MLLLLDAIVGTLASVDSDGSVGRDGLRRMETGFVVECRDESGIRAGFWL